MSGKIITSKVQRVLHSTDISLYEIIPSGVAFPENVCDVKDIIDIANERNIPVHSRGAGTSTVGQSLGHGIVIDFTRHMNNVIGIRADHVDVEPGIILKKLNSILKEIGFFMPVDPSSMDVCSIGGMVSNNSSGIHSYLYGDTKDYVLGLEGFWSDGSFFSTITGENEQKFAEELKRIKNSVEKLKDKLPSIKKDSSGYNIKDSLLSKNKIDLIPLIVGSEGTLCTITKVRLKILKIPQKRVTLLSLFDDFEKSLEAVKLAQKVRGVSAIELLDEELIETSKKHFPELKKFFNSNPRSALLFEIDGEDGYVENKAHELEKALSSLSLNTEIGKNEEKRKWLWWMRKSANSILNRIHGSVRSLRFIDDVAVPMDSIIDFYRREKQILDKYGLKTAFFGHIGSGHFHINPKIDTRSKGFMDVINNVTEETYALVKSLGGTLAAEHGDGILRAPYIKKLDPELYSVFADIKDLFDPKHILNPGKIVFSEKAANVTNRYDFTPKYDITKEALDAVEKCHGCNDCVNFCTAFIEDWANDEGHKARGRANLMRGIVSGILERSEISEALSYIEACKLCGRCLVECPTGIDITETASLLRENNILPISTKRKLLMFMFSPFRSMLAKKVENSEPNSVVDIDMFKTVIRLGMYYRPYTRNIMTKIKNKRLRLKIDDELLYKYLVCYLNA